MSRSAPCSANRHAAPCITIHETMRDINGIATRCAPFYFLISVARLAGWLATSWHLSTDLQEPSQRKGSSVRWATHAQANRSHCQRINQHNVKQARQIWFLAARAERHTLLTLARTQGSLSLSLSPTYDGVQTCNGIQ